MRCVWPPPLSRAGVCSFARRLSFTGSVRGTEKTKGKRQKAKGKNKKGRHLPLHFCLLIFAFCLLPFVFSLQPPTAVSCRTRTKRRSADRPSQVLRVSRKQPAP